MAIDIYLWPSNVPAGADVWLRDPTQGQASTGITLTANVGVAQADAPTAQFNITLLCAPARASATGVDASISTSGSTVLVCSVGNALATGAAHLLHVSLLVNVGSAAASGVQAQIPQRMLASVGAATASAPSVLLPRSLQASVSQASAIGVSAQLLTALRANVGQANAQGISAGLAQALAAFAAPAEAGGVPFKLRSSLDIIPGALVGQRPEVHSSRPVQAGQSRPAQNGASRPAQAR